MNDLMMLWRKRILAVLGIVRAGEKEHREIANMAAQVGADYHGRFIVELLQNASDQACEAGLTESTVTVIRTAELVAVANEGAPFTEDGLRSITSLGLSTKNPQDAIGNKGIGFKSVFQVSERPEVYSADAASASFVDSSGLMFRMSLTPFEDAQYASVARSMIEEQLRADAQTCDSDAIEALFAEITAAAPFKFPLPLSLEDVESRLSQLSERPPGQTLVVLPLRQTKEVTKTVDFAIDELFQNAGAAILFLPCVSSIRVVDRVRGFDRTIGRRPVSEPRLAAEGYGTLVTVVTDVRENGAVKQRMWRTISRKMGFADVVSVEQAADEAQRINEEARKLPGSNWDRVRSSPVSVAVPVPSSSVEKVMLLGANGRVCIGLPTKDPTGTPAWINAHFYGTISRTGIDLVENGYNVMLFQEAVRLHETLIADLKADGDIPIRRAATLAFQKDKGPLAEVLHAPGGQASGDIILAADGVSYQSPNTTILPDAADLDTLLLMLLRPSDSTRFGFNLPEIELARSARTLIEALMGQPSDAAVVSALFLARKSGRTSLLEYSAMAKRHAGPVFWEPFLTWVVERFAADQIDGQEFLPIGHDALARPSDRVFLPPSGQQVSVGAAEADGEITELPANVVKSLRFLDETAVPVRKADSHNLTELASNLAPDTSRGLVRRPRYDELINDAIGPLMQQLETDSASRRIGANLLRQAVQWLWKLSDTGRERLTRDALRVPVLTTGQVWAWVPPSGVYFGPGWTETPIDGLLREAYGHDPSQLLIPWDAFAGILNLPKDDRDDWAGALEVIGVSRSPKIIRSGSGHRPAPLRSWGGIALTIDSGKCPIPQADLFWRPYLESTRRRSANTSSGQRFDYRPLVWIDGLELDGSRSAVIRLMLLTPQSYEHLTTVSLERQDRPHVDSTVVPALWVHAIMANQWPVIPTQRGPVAVSDAWLLDGQQRGLARWRLALLNQVESPYDAADRLLPGMGVTTLQAASVDRLLHAIHQLGTACAGFDAETRHTALALAEDLFSHLQTVYAKNVPDLPNLKALNLPLERSGQAIGVPGSQIAAAYFNDDPVRARFVVGFKDALVWPLQIRHAYKDLVGALRTQLGKSSVIFTSLAQVDSRFTEDTGMKRIPLLEWLASTFSQDSVASDLACLIAYTGRRDSDPNGEDFKRTWQAFQNAVLAFGSFPPESPAPYFYDRTTQILQVGASIGNTEKIEATWMLVGMSYRDTWAAYARDLDRGIPGKFLADHQISSAQRENVENAIGLSSTERFKRIRAAVLMLWFLRFGKQPLGLFEQEWNVNARSVRGLCDWLGRQDLGDAFAASLGNTEEDATLTILRAANLQSYQWQEARTALGLEPWRFSHKVKAWRDTGNEIVAILKTCAARSVSASLTGLEPILRDNRFCETPDDVACRNEGGNDMLAGLVRVVGDVLQDASAIMGIELLQRRLAAIAEKARSGIGKVALDDARMRDVRVYRDEDEGKRSRDAEARFQGLMTVSVALGKALGEEVVPDTIQADARVSLLLNGWWANCFSIMVAIQRVLQAVAPKTAQRMSDERVFRDPAPANELLSRFPELAAAGLPPIPPAPKRIVTVLGQTKAEDDLEKELLRGTVGVIGQVLKALAEKQALRTDMGKLARSTVTAPDTSHRKSGGGGGGGGTGNKKDKELAGLLGEAFIYEQFRLALPGFDERSWRSCNRNLYGLEGAGDDSLGFDFSYRDVEGRLTAEPERPMCYMDVKASSGDGTEPFQMSVNEWNKTRECHESSDSVYAIIRVAHVRDAPSVVDIIRDPFGLYRKGQLALAAQDMWIHVGRAIPPVAGT